MTDPCKDETLLSAYLDGELPESRADEVRRHLASCSRCRKAFESLAQTDALVQKFDSIEPSTDFDRTFWQKVEAIEEQKEQRHWFRYLFRGWRPVLAGGLAGLAVAVFIYSVGTKALSPEEMFIAEHMELLNNYDLIGELEMLEHWEAIEAMEEQS